MSSSSISTTVMYRGRLIEIVRNVVATPDGEQTFELARRGPGTRVIFDRGDDILLTTEYRYELGTFDLRLPGGKVYDSLTEYEAALDSGAEELLLAEEAARREGTEEVGLRARTMTHLATSVCGATVKWDLYYFSTTDWDELPDGPHLEKGEQISLSWTKKSDVLEAALDGRISEERSALQLIRYISLQAREGAELK